MNNVCLILFNIISVDKKHCIVIFDKLHDVVIYTETAPTL